MESRGNPEQSLALEKVSVFGEVEGI